MSNVGMYLFRIAKGHSGDKPKSSCPVGFQAQIPSIINKLANIAIDIIDYENNGYEKYIHDELWGNKTLRQGWGSSRLDLNLFKSNEYKWVENFIIGHKKYLGVDISDDNCKLVYRCLHILKHMIDAPIGSIFFIPKHSSASLHDGSSFSVCVKSEDYTFDLNTTYNDFGHSVRVLDLKEFKYSNDTLLPGDFSGYLRAAGRIRDSHVLYKNERFKKFMEKNYSQAMEN